MSFVVNNREYQKPRRTKTWVAVALTALVASVFVAYRALL
jgi:hypothetical protein